MANDKIHCRFSGRITIVGFGSIGQGVLPLILRHTDVPPGRLSVVSADDGGRPEAERYGVKFVHERLDPGNFRRVLEPLVGRGDFLLNVAVEVSSLALIELAWERGALYLDTCIEPWAGGYTDPNLPAAQRTNYALREQALALRARSGRRPTAVLTHGANPGLVSHFLKQGLLDVAADTGAPAGDPVSRADWADLARRLGVKTIHVAERDTQAGNLPKRPGEFVNTWSVDGFVGEGSQPCELGWGTHERELPPDARRHESGCGCGIYLTRPGAATRVRTWTPLAGRFHGFCITHGESLSLSDYLTVREGGRVAYRPTVHYAYHPCDAAVVSLHEFAGHEFEIGERKRILMDEIVQGTDELGVLIAGHARNAYWYGSQLSIAEARALAPYNNATSLQVTVACLGGMVWAMENPERGLIEPEEMDYRRVLEISRPYLGSVVGRYTDWNPLVGRGRLFPEDLDASDPWQFRNVRVAC